AGAGLQRRPGPCGGLGRRRLRGAAHDRRPRPPPAREGGGGSQRARADPDRAGRRLPAARGMRHLQTVGARLALALLLVVAAVLAFVYLIVTPSLEDRVIGSREAQVAGISQEMGDHWPPTSVTA